jgi:hypothetical protein
MRDDAILILSQQQRLLVLLFQKIKGTKQNNWMFFLYNVIVTGDVIKRLVFVLNIFIFQRKILCQCKAPNYLRTCTLVKNPITKFKHSSSCSHFVSF